MYSEHRVETRGCEYAEYGGRRRKKTCPLERWLECMNTHSASRAASRWPRVPKVGFAVRQRAQPHDLRDGIDGRARRDGVERLAQAGGCAALGRRLRDGRVCAADDQLLHRRISPPPRQGLRQGQVPHGRLRGLVFPGPEGLKSIIKTAWVLPIAAQTASTGTLADFLRTLGATVTEVDLDAEDGDSDEEDERDGNALVDDEAEEEEEEE